MYKLTSDICLIIRLALNLPAVDTFVVLNTSCLVFEVKRMLVCDQYKIIKTFSLENPFKVKLKSVYDRFFLQASCIRSCHTCPFHSELRYRPVLKFPMPLSASKSLFFRISSK